MKKNFEIKYEYTGYNNELKSVVVEGKEYGLNELTFEAKELLTVMTYEDYDCSLQYFNNIAEMIGYETTIKGILDLNELGVDIASGSIYRMLVLNSYKNKYKGMWR